MRFDWWYESWLIDWLNIFFVGYVIAKTTHKPGTPERPLSWPGLLAFTSYWKCVVSHALLKNWDKTEHFNELMDALVTQLGMAKDDVEDTFVRLNLIKTDPRTKKLMLLKEPVKVSEEKNSNRFLVWIFTTIV